MPLRPQTFGLLCSAFMLTSLAGRRKSETFHTSGRPHPRPSCVCTRMSFLPRSRGPAKEGRITDRLDRCWHTFGRTSRPELLDIGRRKRNLDRLGDAAEITSGVGNRWGGSALAASSGGRSGGRQRALSRALKRVDPQIVPKLGVQGARASPGMRWIDRPRSRRGERSGGGCKSRQLAFCRHAS